VSVTDFGQRVNALKEKATAELALLSRLEQQFTHERTKEWVRQARYKFSDVLGTLRPIDMERPRSATEAGLFIASVTTLLQLGVEERELREKTLKDLGAGAILVP
jgi:hypothetical protein